MGVWPGLTREEVEEFAAAYLLTVEKVRAIAQEKYPDDEHEAESLSQRATRNLRASLIADLKESGCPPEEVEGWVTAILQAAERPTDQTSSPS
jgi:hypothetical protein